MTRNSTQFLSFSDIDISSIDLVADAFGYSFYSLGYIKHTSSLSVEPGEDCINRILGEAGLR